MVIITIQIAFRQPPCRLLWLRGFDEFPLEVVLDPVDRLNSDVISINRDLSRLTLD